MKRFVMLGSLSLLLSSLPTFSQVKSLGHFTDAQASKLIQEVQNMPASKLDARLPSTRLADWLRIQLGDRAQISWVLRYAPSDESRQASGFPDCVEMDAMIKGNQSVVMLIAVGHSKRPAAYLYELGVMSGGDKNRARVQSAELDRLSALPSFLENLRQISGTNNE
jgi:hypothetical protein